MKVLPMDDRILALLNWDEVERWPREPAYFDILTKMLDNEPPEMKRVIVAILGSSWTASIYPAMQTRLVGYLLESSDYESVLAAAKALRFRDGLPVDDILKMLEQEKDENIRQQLGDILLSSLGSPKTFWHLVRSFYITDPKNVEVKKRRADEMRIWYLRLGDKGDDVVRQAIPSTPRNIQDMVIEWLQDISKIKFSNPALSKAPFAQGGPTFIIDSTRESEINKDIESFVEIAKRLAEAENKVLTSTKSNF